MNLLKSELETAKARQIWDTMKQDNKFFVSLLPDELKQLSEVSKTLKMFRGDTIAKTGEKLAWFGVVLLGQIGVYNATDKVFTLKVSDIINYMHVLPGMVHHTFDLQVLQPGYISLFFQSDMQNLSATNPALHYKLVQILCLKSLNTISLQYLNSNFVQDASVIWSEYPSKKVQEYINKVPELVYLCAEFFDKNEAKIFQAACRVLHVDVGKALVRNGQYEGCLFVVVAGEISVSGGRSVREKEVVGFEEFFFGKPWTVDLVSVSLCDVIVISRTVFRMLAAKSLNSAIRVYKVLHRMYLNYIKKFSRFNTQSYFIETDLSLFKPPIDNPYKYNSISFLDVSYNSNNLLPKTKESAGLFITSKFQQQTDQIKAATKQPKPKRPKEPEKFTKEYLKEQLLKTESGFVNLEDELEDSVLYRDEVHTKMSKLQEEYHHLKSRNEELKNLLKKKEQDKDVLGVKMQMNVVMKDIQNLEEVKSSMKNPFLSVVNRSFYDITQAQIRAHREKILAVKYAEKWKAFVKKRKDFKILQQRGRFWPGE